MPVEEECKYGEYGCEYKFKLRKGEKNRVKFLYLYSVALLGFTAALIAWATISGNDSWFFAIIFVVLFVFISAFTVSMRAPKKYRENICTELRVLYKDFGTLRWRRNFVMLFDIMIASFATMIFAWDFVHDVVSVANGVGPEDAVPLMYVWSDPSWEWTLLKQGWLDFGFAVTAAIMIVLELILWFDKRMGNVCALGVDDLPIPFVDDYENRVKNDDGDFWMDIGEKIFEKMAKEDKSI